MFSKTESGMLFEFPKSDVFDIESSVFYKKKQPNLSSVEFLLLKNDKLFLIEAKRSFPKVESKADFNKNIQDISDKFIHSFELFLSNFVEVNEFNDIETPEKFQNFNFSSCSGIVFVLIINCSKIDRNDVPNMISYIQDQFKDRFKGQNRIWNIDFIALDNELALEKKLVSKMIP